MAMTHRLRWSFTRGTETIYAEKDYSVEAEINVSIAVPATTDDVLIAFVLDISQLKTLLMKADGALLVETNVIAGTDDVTLAANAGYMWAHDSGMLNPFTADITALYASNAGASPVNLEIRCGYDPVV